MANKIEFKVFENIPAKLKLSHVVRKGYRLFSTFDHTKQAIEKILSHRISHPTWLLEGQHNTMDKPNDYYFNMSFQEISCPIL
jgi:hypothetical protein